MTMQYRPRPGDAPYSPARDLAYIYPTLVEGVEQRLYDGPFSPLKEWLEAEGVDDEQLSEVVRSYCSFLNAAHQKPGVPAQQCMEEAGWFQQSAPGRVAMMFYLGAAVTAAVFSGIRDVTYEGEEPPANKRIKQVVERVSAYMAADEERRAKLREQWAAEECAASKAIS